MQTGLQWNKRLQITLKQSKTLLDTLEYIRTVVDTLGLSWIGYHSQIELDSAIRANMSFLAAKKRTYVPV